MASDFQIHNKIIQPVDCMIMAAGLSSRMEKWKMMLPFFPAIPPYQKAETILDVSIRHALEFCHRVILVTGYRGSELADRYRTHSRICIVHHTGYQQGLFSSIKKGITTVKTEYVFITHGDMPFISQDIFSALWQKKQRCTLFPQCPSTNKQNSSNFMQQGHPVLLHRDMFTAIKQSANSMSMKQLLHSYPYKNINIPSNGIYKDIDTPEDYRLLISHYP